MGFFEYIVNKSGKFGRLLSQRLISYRGISGLTLVEVLTASSILGILGYGVARMSGTAFQAASLSNNRQDLASLKMVVREQVNCAQTLGLPDNYDFSVPAPCAGPYLLRKNGNVLLGTSISGDSERTLIGDYKVRATCSNNQLDVMVQSTRIDPLTKVILPPRNLFSGSGGNGLCSQYFTGVACPAGTTRTGISDGMPVCTPVSPCPTGQVQTGVSNGVPVCANSGGCPGGQVQTGTSNGLPVCTVPQACTPPYYQVGFSNNLPVCQYWNGCPDGTFYQGTLSGGWWPVCDKIPAPTPNPNDYIMVVTGSPQAGSRCAGKHKPSIAVCPDGWVATACGYYLSSWKDIDKYASNAPDTNGPIDVRRCHTVAGGRPSPNACFVSTATCLNLSKIANGR